MATPFTLPNGVPILQSARPYLGLGPQYKWDDLRFSLPSMRQKMGDRMKKRNDHQPAAAKEKQQTRQNLKDNQAIRQAPTAPPPWSKSKETR